MEVRLKRKIVLSSMVPFFFKFVLKIEDQYGGGGGGGTRAY